VLPHAAVQVVLDSATLGVGGQCEPPTGRLQLRHLETQPVERSLQRLDVPSLQGDRPLFLVTRLAKLSVIARAASRDPAPRTSGGQPPTYSPAPTVVPGVGAS
jgi:hypothetical protein